MPFQGFLTRRMAAKQLLPFAAALSVGGFRRAAGEQDQRAAATVTEAREVPHRQGRNDVHATMYNPFVPTYFQNYIEFANHQMAQTQCAQLLQLSGLPRAQEDYICAGNDRFGVLDARYLVGGNRRCRLLWPAATITLHIVVPKNSSIHTPGQLRGRTLSVGNFAFSGLGFDFLGRFLSQAELSKVYLGYGTTDGINRILSGKAEAFIVLTQRDFVIAEYLARELIRLVPIPRSEIEQLAGMGARSSVGHLPAIYLPWELKDLKYSGTMEGLTVSEPSVVIACADSFPRTAAYDLIKMFWEYKSIPAESLPRLIDNETLQRVDNHYFLPQEARVEARFGSPDSLVRIKWPIGFHQGALDFYREAHLV